MLRREGGELVVSRAVASAPARRVGCYAVGWRGPASDVLGVLLVSASGLTTEEWSGALRLMTTGGGSTSPVRVSVDEEGRTAQFAWFGSEPCERWGLDGVELAFTAEMWLSAIHISLPPQWT